MTELHGDEEAADLAGEFVEAVRELLREYGAEEVKRIGDAVMIRCEDAALAVVLAIRIVNEVGGRPGFPIVRVGMNTGPAAEREGDWFGVAVNVAARVAGAAAGGEVILTEPTRDAAGPLKSIELRPRGRRKLKNVSEPVQLYAATAEGRTTVGELPVDPVCRMAVDRVHSAGSLRFHGVRYFFCSLECVDAFALNPDRYAEGIARPDDC